jgi:membrane-associated phospholipid phosphatase
MWNAIVQWDRDTFFAVNNGLQHPLMDVVMPLISDLGLGHVQALVVLLAAVWMGVKRGEIHVAGFFGDTRRALGRRKAWLWPLLTAFALSGIIAGVIKNNVDRHRPAWFYKHEHEAGRSLDRQVHTMPDRRPIRVRGFLSGHTATSVALATAFTLLARRRKWWRGWAITSWAIAGLVSFSRIYVADHWPLDVVAGAALGVLCGLVGVWIGSRWAGKQNRELEEPPPDAGLGANQVTGSA